MIRMIALLCMAPVSVAIGQTKVNGMVKDTGAGKGLAGVNITIREKGKPDLLAFALSDEKGFYQVGFSSSADSLTIAASGLSIKKQILVIANKSQTINFIVSADTIQLKEIKVKPPRIRRLGDTLSYDVSAFTTLNDRTIGDVLKKMPGITVKEDGSINYNNKPINKFYIEGADLLQGRYGIATNNIEAKDVATVEVLENHQPVKILKEREFTDEGAINLKLKNSAKGVLVANGQAGVGISPLLWNNELFSMLIGKRRQNINTYKGNNAGYDAGAELRTFYPQANQPEKRNILAVQSPLPPPISQKRFLFNQCNAFSFNNLWTPGKDLQLNANLSYLNDTQKRNSYMRSVYYLGADSLLTIEEQMSATEKTNLLNAQVQLTENADGRYLENVLSLNADWDANKANVINIANTAQDLGKSFYSVFNTLSSLRNKKRYNVRLNSFNGYSSTPQTLSIQPWSYDGFINVPGAQSTLVQAFEQKRFASSTRLTIGAGSGFFKHNYVAGINMSLQKIESELSGQTESQSTTMPADSLRNQLKWNHYELFFSPGYTFASKKVKATITLPLSFNYLHASNVVKMDEDNNKRLFFNPSFNLRYQISLLLNASFSASQKSKLGDVENGFTGYIMRAPRSISKSDGQLPQYQNTSYSTNLAYKQPLREFFLNLGLSYSRERSNLLYGYNYRGIVSLKESYNIPNVNSTYHAFAMLSKGIAPFASTLTVEGGYRSTSAKQISQELLLNYISTGHQIKSAINSRVNKWAVLTYSFEFTRSGNRILDEGFRFKAFKAAVHRTQLNLVPIKKITLTAGYENFYNNSFGPKGGNISFADAAIRFKSKNLELNLEHSNIGDTRKFSSGQYNEISGFSSEYDLRPSQWLLKARFKIK